MPVGAGAPPELGRQTQAVDRALSWLRAQQRPDGSFQGSAGITLDVVFAGAAAGEDVALWRNAEGLPTAFDFLVTQVVSYTTTAGKAGKALAGAVAAGAPITIVTALAVGTQAYDPGRAGRYADGPFDQSWAMLGLTSARMPLPAGAGAHLLGMQAPDGGWGFPGWGSDPDTTAIAVQALVATGLPVTSTAVLSATHYLSTTQVASGGFNGFGSDANEANTASAIQALIAAGQNPLATAWLQGGRSALDDLLSLQFPDGAFKGWEGTGDVMITAQVVPAILGKTLPLCGRVPALRDALGYLATMQQADGSYAGNKSAHVLLALDSAGLDPRTWRQAGGPSLIESLESSRARIGEAGTPGRLAAGLAMAGENPYLFGHLNLVAAIWRFYDPLTGSFDAHLNTWNHVLALWGLTASGESVPPQAVAWLRGEQHPDGGWGWARGFPSDSNSTSLAIQALVGCGVSASDPAIVASLGYLNQSQLPDGGWAWDVQISALSDADSTGMGIAALLASGRQPQSGWDWARHLTGTAQISMTVRKPFDPLLGLQRPEGAFEWLPGTGTDLMATVDAIPALAGRPFPWVSPNIAAAKRALAWLKAQQQADGSLGGGAGATLDVVLAASALGEDVAAWRASAGAYSPLDYLATQVLSYTTDAGRAGKLLAAAVANGRTYGPLVPGRLEARLRSFDPTHAGQFDSGPVNQAWAILGLAAAGADLPAGATTHLLAMQGSDGGWGAPGWGSDPDSTALSLQALVAAGQAVTSTAVLSGTLYLRGAQVATGGFTGWGSEANASTTAWCLQALAAVRASPLSEPWLRDGRSALGDLLALQSGAGAYVGWTGAPDVSVTAQAILGLLMEPNPLRPELSLWLPLVSTRGS